MSLITFVESVKLGPTACQSSYPLKSENARPPGTFRVYLSCLSCAEVALPPKTASDRLRQELAAVTFKEFGLQDCNTLEATQTMLETRAVTHFPLNDQEILIRHLHKTAGEYVDAYKERQVRG